MTTDSTRTTPAGARPLRRALIRARWRVLLRQHQARALACDLIDAWLPRTWHTTWICPYCRSARTGLGEDKAAR